MRSKTRCCARVSDIMESPAVPHAANAPAPNVAMPKIVEAAIRRNVSLLENDLSRSLV
jgi:hypothetical protein